MSHEEALSREARNTMRRLRHALRTPIGQIVGYSELLQEEARESGRQDTIPDLERIRQAALGLLGLVDEMLGGELPAAPGASTGEPAPPATTGAAASGARSGGQLLVVDDDPRNRDLLSRRLAHAGHRVSAVSDGRAALHAITEQPFDLVLLDVLMPGMSGLQVLGAIRREHPLEQLPVILATALDGSEDVVEGLRLGANDHVTKPFDFPVVLARVEAQLALKRANDEIATLARHLEIRNAFIRRTFGRYVSDEVVSTLLETPEALDLRGESREVTILNADLRGFSSLTSECAPTEVLAVLNHYLGAMSEVIQSHEGIIDDFFGDGILAFFGAPVARPDHAAMAVRCAVAMQLALRDVNRTNRGQGLPEVEMGIGIATGEVIVGSMGSEKRSKYGSIGLPVNLAARIESCTLGGEILISEATLERIGDAARIDQTRELLPKGFETRLRIHRVAGLATGEGLELPDVETSLVPLPQPVPLEVAILDGKQVGGRVIPGSLRQLSLSAARIECAEVIEEMSDVRLSFPRADGEGLEGACYAKVVSGSDGALTVRFTARPAALIERMRRFLAALS